MYYREFSVEAQIFENGDLLVRRRFDTRAVAVNWAMPEGGLRERRPAMVPSEFGPRQRIWP